MIAKLNSENLKYKVSITSSLYFTLEEFKYSAACFEPLTSINLTLF